MRVVKIAQDLFIDEGVAATSVNRIAKEAGLTSMSVYRYFGTKDGLAAFFKFYDDSRAAIPKECDPQEVYFYEYNNHECMIAWDGDKEAYDLIVGYWGEEVAKTIERL